MATLEEGIAQANATVESMAPVAAEMAASVNASFATMDSAASTLGPSFVDAETYLASLNATAATTADAMAGLDASLATVDTSLATVDSSLATVDASLASADASAGGFAASLAATNVVMGTTAATASSAATSFGFLGYAQDKARASAASFGEAMAGVGRVLAITVAAITLVGVAIAGVSVKLAGDFKAGLTSLVTGAGEAQKNIQMVGDGILALAPKVGATTGQLIAGMYMIESSGQRGEAALTTLQDVAEGAKVGVAQLGDVANGVTTIMTDYANKNISAAQATNTLIAEVKLGKSHMQDMATAMATILPTSSSVGVSLTDTAAAMATMTAEGTPAAAAATYLKQMLIALEAPAKKGATALKEIGLTSQQVSDEMKKSLVGTLEMITEALNKKFPGSAAVANAEFAKVTKGTETMDQALSHLSTSTSAAYVGALKDIAGGSRQMQGMLELTGSHLQTFRDNMNGVSDAVKKGGDSINGWSNVQGDFNTKLAQAGAALEVVGIKIGEQLLPGLSQMLDQLTPVLGRFAEWISSSGAVAQILGALGTVLGITVGFISGLIATGSAVVGFFQQNQWAAGLLGVALGALGAVMTLFAASAVANMILSLLDFGLSLLTTVAGSLAGAAVMTTTFTTMSGMIVASMGTAAASILAIAGPFLLVGAIIAIVAIGAILAVQHWGQISAWFKGVWAATLDWFKGALGILGSVLQAVGAWFNAWKTPIEVVSGILLTFFGPALIQAGVKAAIAGAQITTSFIGSLIQTGIAATVNAAKVTASFVLAMIQSGTQAVISGAKVTVSFVASMIQTGTEAVINAAKVSGSFVVALVKTGLEGWAAAGKLAVYVGSLIATGTQAVIAAAKVTGSFIVSLLRTGVQAAATGAIMLTSLIPPIIAFAAEAVIAAATAVPAMIAGLIAWGAAAWVAAAGMIAATWPILLIIVAIALLVVGIILLVQHWGQVTAFMRTIWQAFTSWLMSSLQAIGQFFANVWNGIINYLRGAGATIVGEMHNLWSSIVSFVSGWPAQAVQWGINLIQGFINGIGSMLGAVGNAAANIMNTVKGFLGFHSPTKEGPGKELDIWGPNLVKGFAHGIDASQPILQASLDLLMKPVGQAMHVAPASGTAPVAASSGSGGKRETHIHVHVGSHEVAHAIADDVAEVVVDRMRFHGVRAA